jgi:acyl carrier protein phosphodiesterase
MNYLAHLYLSGQSDERMLGNFLGDFVKRKEFVRYSPEIIKGIELHHRIDEFTDKHPIVLLSKQRLRTKYRHYAGVIVDIYYDHFLARHWHRYSDIPLERFAAHAYSIMRKHYDTLPPKVQYMLPHMEQNNWLVNYAKMTGVERVFQGMARRTSFHSGMEHAQADLLENYEAYEREFLEFFSDLITFSNELSARI